MGGGRVSRTSFVVLAGRYVRDIRYVKVWCLYRYISCSWIIRFYLLVEEGKYVHVFTWCICKSEVRTGRSSSVGFVMFTVFTMSRLEWRREGCLRLNRQETLYSVGKPWHSTLAPVASLARSRIARLTTSLPELFETRVPLCQPGTELEFIGLVNKVIPPEVPVDSGSCYLSEGVMFLHVFVCYFISLVPYTTCLNKIVRGKREKTTLIIQIGLFTGTGMAD